VIPRGVPSYSKRPPSAASMRSGVLSPEDELTLTTAPSGISRAACSKESSLFGIRLNLHRKDAKDAKERKDGK